MSSSSARAWSATQSASMARASSTPAESCTVSAVSTESGWQPMLDSVMMSAWRPAPPDGSEAANTMTMGAAGPGAWAGYRLAWPEANGVDCPILTEKVRMTAPAPYRTWMCLVCGFIYDEAAGLPEEGIPPGTRWEDVPPNWACPECGARKEDFELVEI
jgi:rubredoxin